MKVKENMYLSQIVKYNHIGNKIHKSLGKITIASVIKDGMIYYGISFCSPKDTFNKSLGRKISYNRLIHKPVTVKVVENTHKSITFSILVDLLESCNYPEWAYLMLLNQIDLLCVDQDDIKDDIDIVNKWMSEMPNVRYEIIYDIMSNFLDETISHNKIV